MIILSLALAAAVPNYNQLPPPENPNTELHCNNSIHRLSIYVAQYHGFVDRHEMDYGGRLTPDEGAAYREEADNYVGHALDVLREMRFEHINPVECRVFVDQVIWGLTHDVIVRRFGDAWQKGQ